MTKKPKTPRTRPNARRRPRAGAKSPARAKPRPAATVARDPLDPFIEAAAHALDLSVDPSWRPAVKMNLQIILRQAALFTEFSLPDEAEPAPVFTA
jgi:hypothetical protein